ncbi:MAG: GNAT family N-acetyltransferase [Chloroflexi bacterium]|nr:GNAT family N-acetyltransferase [Chloroflexota bacterium]
MQLDLIKDREAFQALESEWNQLVPKSTMDVPFLRHEFLRVWWETLGGGEWKSGDLRIIIARDEQGHLAAIAPLFRTYNEEGDPVLMFIGSVEIADYLDLIVRKESSAHFIRLLLDELGKYDELEWSKLDLYNLPDWSETTDLLRVEAEGHGWKVREKLLQPCPLITLDAGWSGYLSSLDKKQRHELKRKMRRMDAQPEGIRFRIVNHTDDIEKETDAYLRLMAYDPKKAAFLSSAMRSNIRALIRAGLKNNWLMLTFLDIGDQPAAVSMNFDYGNRIWVYNSGILPAYHALSPGWVLLGYTIRWAAENGREALDFMRGDEVYKYRLGGVDRFIKHIEISR